MLLSDYDIRHLQRLSGIIEPFDDEAVQPASYDLRWDGSLRYLVPEGDYVNPEVIDSTNKSDSFFSETLIYESVLVGPRAFYLISTLETVTIPRNYAARVEGKSSLGRIGLSIHTTAGFIDPGFTGQITLEISNNSNRTILLNKNQKIGQLCLFTLSSPALYPYGTPNLGSAYQGQRGPTTGEGTRG